jgi:hypothetical protein
MAYYYYYYYYLFVCAVSAFGYLVVDAAPKVNNLISDRSTGSGGGDIKTAIIS